MSAPITMASVRRHTAGARATLAQLQTYVDTLGRAAGFPGGYNGSESLAEVLAEQPVHVEHVNALVRLVEDELGELRELLREATA